MHGAWRLVSSLEPGTRMGMALRVDKVIDLVPPAVGLPLRRNRCELTSTQDSVEQLAATSAAVQE